MNLPVDLNASKGLEPGSVLQESAPMPDVAKKTLTVGLASGGAVEISVDVDLLRLDKGDREFVFDLIDRARGYRHDGQCQKERDAEHPGEPVPILRGDEEVPF
jgi:hypothetical protein